MIDFFSYFFACLGFAAGIFSLITRNLIYIGLAFLVILFVSAALFVLNGYDFLAMNQIIVYVGGILVMLLFGIMLTQRREYAIPESGYSNLIPGIIITTLISIAVFSGLSQIKFGSMPLRFPSIKSLGISLFTTHLLIFELLSIFLLLALIGAIYIIKDEGTSAATFNNVKNNR